MLLLHAYLRGSCAASLGQCGSALQDIMSPHPTVVFRTGWAATVLEIVAALLGHVVLRVMYTESATTI